MNSNEDKTKIKVNRLLEENKTDIDTLKIFKDDYYNDNKILAQRLFTFKNLLYKLCLNNAQGSCDSIDYEKQGVDNTTKDNIKNLYNILLKYLKKYGIASDMPNNKDFQFLYYELLSQLYFVNEKLQNHFIKDINKIKLKEELEVIFKGIYGVDLLYKPELFKYTLGGKRNKNGLTRRRKRKHHGTKKRITSNLTKRSK